MASSVLIGPIRSSNKKEVRSEGGVIGAKKLPGGGKKKYSKKKLLGVWQNSTQEHGKCPRREDKS